VSAARRATTLGALVAVSAVGCGVSLADRPVTALEADAMGVESVCPGERFPIEVVARLADGERLATQGAGGGEVRWDDYVVRVRGGDFEDGAVQVSEDARALWPARRAEVTVRSRHHEDVEPEVFGVPVSFACQITDDVDLVARGEDGIASRIVVDDRELSAPLGIARRQGDDLSVGDRRREHERRDEKRDGPCHGRLPS